MIARFDKAVNKTHKYKLITALQQRQHKNTKDFLDRCKTAWYGLFRRNRATYATDPERAAHDMQHREQVHTVHDCLRNAQQLEAGHGTNCGEHRHVGNFTSGCSSI
jgi:hypothetical protein